MQNKRDNANDNKDKQTQMTSGTYTSKPHALWNPLLPKKLDTMQSTFGKNKRIDHIIFHIFAKQYKSWDDQIKIIFDGKKMMMHKHHWTLWFGKKMMLYIRKIGDATYKSTHKNNYNVKENVMNNRNEKTQMTLTL